MALAGTSGFAKYLRFGRPHLAWKLGQRLDGRQVAVADEDAAVDLPLTEEQVAGAGALYLRLSAPAGALTVRLGDAGPPVATVPLVTGWQTVTVPLPPGGARAGDNHVRLAFAPGKAGSVEWMQLGGPPPGDDPPPLLDSATQALRVPRGGGLRYYLMVPAAARLSADILDAACVLTVRAVPAEGAAVTGEIAGHGASLDLGALAGKVVRLDLGVRGCPEARVARAVLTVPGPAPTVKRGKKPGHVLFWIMDALRADRVRAFHAGARPETPTFDRLAATSTIFTRAYSQGNETRASQAAIWTSLYVVNHHMVPSRAQILDSRWVTLGEAMQAAGYYTAGVTANGYICQYAGFADGWNDFKNNLQDETGLAGLDVWNDARAMVEGRTAKPFFLFVGTIDTHVSWRGKQPWLDRYDPGPYQGRFQTAATGFDVDRITAGELTVSARDKQRMIALYDSNVSYQDDLLAQALAQLEAWGIADDTMVVVTADHGDAQWESGAENDVGHGISLADALVHVPLLIHYPPDFPAVAVDEGVDILDILPTLLDAAGAQPPEEAQGASLLPLAQGVGRGYVRPSFSSFYENAFAMRLGDWKAVVGESGAPALYRLDADPNERTDLAASRPLELRFLTDVMSTFLVYQSDWKRARWGVASNVTPEFTADLER